MYLRALVIREQALGPKHPDTALSLNNLAGFYQIQKKYAEAESLLLHSLAIYEQVLGPNHPDTALSLNNLAILYKNQGKYKEAEPLYLRALVIWEQALGPTHSKTVDTLYGLAKLYQKIEKYEPAETFYQRILAIHEQQLGPEHPTTQTVRENYNFFLSKMEREREEGELMLSNYEAPKSLSDGCYPLSRMVISTPIPHEIPSSGTAACYILLHCTYNMVRHAIRQFSSNLQGDFDFCTAEAGEMLDDLLHDLPRIGGHHAFVDLNRTIETM